MDIFDPSSKELSLSEPIQNLKKLNFCYIKYFNANSLDNFAYRIT
jgi:hypothetical protein